jgi:hypothetical protein
VKGALGLSRLLGLWLVSFAGLLIFLYMLFIGCSVGGRPVFQLLVH